LHTWSGRLLIKYGLYLSDYISFRDERSCQLIREIGFTRQSVVAADCVYALPVPRYTVTLHRPESGESSVGISPMQVYWDANPEVYSHLIQEMARFCSWLARGSYQLQLFGTDVWYDSRAVADLRMATLRECQTADSTRITCPSLHSFSTLLAQMATMEYVVTCRYHGVVFAHLLNIPVLALSHHGKVATLMNDIGLAEYCLDIIKFDSRQLTHTFGRLVENAAEIRKIMAERAADYQRKLTLQFDSLFPVCLDQESRARLFEVLRQARDSGKVRAKSVSTASVTKGGHND
jgi:polysaccharide pyruvyl transferase WcaK-like protein